jgi:hypothetical protein
MTWFIDCPSGLPSFSPVAIECVRCKRRRSPLVGRLEGIAIGENPPPQLPRFDGARRVQRLRLCLFPADDLHRSRNDGLDGERIRTAEEQLRAWRDRGELPLPDFAEESKIAL